MKNHFIFLITISSLLFITSCKKEQPQMSSLNEGCDCAKEVSADFLMEEMTSGNTNWALYTNTDSIYSKKNVRFTANEDSAEYTWYIGTEILHTRSITRYFDNSLQGQSLPITLVVKKKANTICFPNDDGYDSIVKQLHVSNQIVVTDSSYLLEGMFRFKEQNSNDSVDIIVDFRSTLSSSPFIVDLYNYDGNGTNSIGDYGVPSYNYRQIWFYLGAHKAILHHHINSAVTLNIIGNSSSFPSYYYTGRKL